MGNDKIINIGSSENDDIYSMSLEEILDYRKKMTQELSRLDSSEPENIESKAHERWEDEHEELEDWLDEIDDLIDELK